MYPLQGQAGIPMRGDLWVCPLCFSSSGAEDPVDAVVQRKKDDNLVAQAFSAASMCFATKAAVAEHVKRIHGIADCKSKKYVDLFHRFRFRGADGIVQRHVYAQGQRHILAINAYWARSQDKNHNKRDYYNVIRAIVLSGCVSDPPFHLRKRRDADTWNRLVEHHIQENNDDKEFVDDELVEEPVFHVQDLSDTEELIEPVYGDDDHDLVPDTDDDNEVSSFPESIADNQSGGRVGGVMVDDEDAPPIYLRTRSSKRKRTLVYDDEL